MGCSEFTGLQPSTIPRQPKCNKLLQFEMSGGSGGGAAAFVRQRYNVSGYSSSGGEDLEEDDASGPSMDYRPQSSRLNGWYRRFETLVWLASAVFIIYCGDLHSNFLTLLLRDERIKRTALNLGLLCVACNIGIFLYLSFWVKDMAKVDDRWEILSPAAIPTATVIGLLAFFSVLLGLVANMEFLNIASIVHIVYGFCGYISIYSSICKNETRCILAPLGLMETF